MYEDFERIREKTNLTRRHRGVSHTFEKADLQSYEISKEGRKTSVFNIICEGDCIGRIRIYPNSEIDIYLKRYVRMPHNEILRDFISAVWKGEISVPAFPYEKLAA